MLVGAVIFVVVLFAGWFQRVGTRYFVTNERLHIRRGIIARRSQETRLERVQNVNTDQSILQRLLRIGTVDFDTAGGGDYDFAFRGVAKPAEVGHVVDQAVRALETGDEPRRGPRRRGSPRRPSRPPRRRSSARRSRSRPARRLRAARPPCRCAPT